MSAIARETAPTPGGLGLRVMVDSTREAVVAVAGPFRLLPSSSAEGPGDMGHAMMRDMEHEVTRLRFDWPVDGWARGYEIGLFDAKGAPMDPSFVHHFLLINFDRRQFVYPTAERLAGAGQETGEVNLPISMGVPLALGQRIGMSAAWHNGTETEVEVFLRLVMRWTPDDGRRHPTEVLPVNLDLNNVPGGSSEYDLPPGRSSRAFEFDAPLDGRLLAISGHAHDYALAVRLEAAESGRRMTEVRAVLDDQRRIIRVEQKKWLGFLGRGIRLDAGKRYRLVGEYDSLEQDTLHLGAMAQMIGVFAPDDWMNWPALDPADPDYRTDVTGWRLDLSAEEFMRSDGSGFESPPHTPH